MLLWQAARATGSATSAARLNASMGSPLRQLMAAESFHDGLVLPEEDLALLLGVWSARLRVDLLRTGVGAHGRGTRADRCEPALEMGKLVDLLALAIGNHPRIRGHVG